LPLFLPVLHCFTPFCTPFCPVNTVRYPCPRPP